MKKSTPAHSGATPAVTFAEFSQTVELRKANDLLLKQLARARSEASVVHGLREENAELQARVDLLERIDSVVPAPPDWTVPPKAKGALHRGIPTLMLSDWHFDEVVNLDEMNRVNEYNREIAIQRLKYVTRGTIMMVRSKLADTKLDGFNLILGGDMLSGQIHEELTQTNEGGSIIASVDFWVDHLVAVVEAFLEEWGRVHITALVGNHGRNTPNVRFKGRVKDNFDWLLSRIVARYFAKDSRVTWQIPESAEVILKLYNTNYLLMHGNDFKGGAGISSMLAPLMLGNARKALQGMALGQPHDYLAMGHWHTHWSGLGLIVNGSGKGFDEFARLKGFRPERAKQALWLTVPETRDLTFSEPVFATKDDIRVVA